MESPEHRVPNPQPADHTHNVNQYVTSPNGANQLNATYSQSPQTVFISLPVPNRWIRFQKRPALVLAVCQICLTVPGLIVNIMGFMKGYEPIGYLFFTGIWCAPFFLLSAGFAIVSSRASDSNIRWRVITTLILSVIASVCAGFFLSSASTAVVVNTTTQEDGKTRESRPYVAVIMVTAICQFAVTVAVAGLACVCPPCCCGQESSDSELGQVLYLNPPGSAAPGQNIQMSMVGYPGDSVTPTVDTGQAEPLPNKVQPSEQ